MTIPEITVGTNVHIRVPRMAADGTALTETAQVKEIKGERALVRMKTRELRWVPLSQLLPAATPIVRPPEQMNERLKLQGTAAADTPHLMALAVMAEKLDFEYQLPLDVIARVDYDGQHIVCLRPQLMEGADTSGLNEDGIGITVLDTTAGTPMPCEVLIKLQGQKSPAKHMLSVRVMDYADLEQLDGPSPGFIFTTIDGQRRKAH